MSINPGKENILSRMEWPGSAHQLALFRILLGFQILYSSSTRLFQLSVYVPVEAGTHNIFPAFLNQFISTTAVPYWQCLTLALSIFLVLGLLTKYILPVLFVAFLFLFSFFYARHNAPIPWLYIWFPLLLLNFTRCNDALSLDAWFGLQKPLTNQTSSAYRWPLEGVAGWFAYIYVAGGLSKIIPIYKGWNWLKGGTTQDLIYNRYLDSIYFYVFERPLFDYTTHHWVFAVLSVASVLIELTCIMILVTHRFNCLVLGLILGMHFFLYLTGVMGFLQLMLVLSVSLIQPGFFNRLFKEETRVS